MGINDKRRDYFSFRSEKQRQQKRLNQRGFNLGAEFYCITLVPHSPQKNALSVKWPPQLKQNFGLSSVVCSSSTCELILFNDDV